MVKLTELREVIAKKSNEQVQAIIDLKNAGKSEKSMQCMKVYTDFDLLVVDCLLGNEESKEKMIKKLDARYNKISWIAIDKSEYIKLLGSDDFDEAKLKAEAGKYYKKA